MPVSTIADRRATMYDAYLLLWDPTSAAITASTAGAALALAATAIINYRARVTSQPYTGYTAGSAQWTINIEASPDGTTWTTVGSCITNGTLEIFDIPLSGSWVGDLVPNAAYIRAHAIMTGSPGALSYGAFLTNSPALA